MLRSSRIKGPTEMTDKRPMPDLLPCPFCGEQPQTKDFEVCGIPQIKIICDGSFCHAHPSVFGNKETMVNVWNTRADLCAKDAIREAFDEAISVLDDVLSWGDTPSHIIKNANHAKALLRAIKDNRFEKTKQGANHDR